MRRRSRSRSTARPTSDVSCPGRLPGIASSDRNGGNSRTSPVATTWKIRSGRARSGRRCSPRSTSATCSGSESRTISSVAFDTTTWPAVGRVHDPRRAVGGRAVVVAVTGRRIAGVDAHSDAQTTGHGPRLGVQRALGGERGVERVPRGGEDGVEPVAGRLHDSPVVLLDRVAQDRVVAFQRRAHRVRMLLPQPRGALEIGEEERHRSRRQLLHLTPSALPGRPHDRTPTAGTCSESGARPSDGTPYPRRHARRSHRGSRRESVQPELVDEVAREDAAVDGDAAFWTR